MDSPQNSSRAARIRQILGATARLGAAALAVGVIVAVYAANRSHRQRETQELLDSVPPSTNSSPEDSQEEPDLLLKPDTEEAEHEALENLTVNELYQRAQQHDIIGRSSMRKAQLVEALRAVEVNDSL